MDLDEFRNFTWEFRQSVDKEAKEMRESMFVFERLCNLYQKFDDSERPMADQIIEEWVLSSDDVVRWDARALVGEFKISSAKLALEKLENRLVTVIQLNNSPIPRNELEDVRKLIKNL